MRGLARSIRNFQRKQWMYITDIFLKTPLSIYFNFFPNFFFQNLSSQTWGAAYLRVQLICRCLRYLSILLQVVTSNFILLDDAGYIWDELIRSCRRPSCRGDILVQTATREAQEGPPARRQLFSTHTPLSLSRVKSTPMDQFLTLGP